MENKIIFKVYFKIYFLTFVINFFNKEKKIF